MTTPKKPIDINIPALDFETGEIVEVKCMKELIDAIDADHIADGRYSFKKPPAAIQSAGNASIRSKSRRAYLRG